VDAQGPGHELGLVDSAHSESPALTLALLLPQAEIDRAAVRLVEFWNAKPAARSHLTAKTDETPRLDARDHRLLLRNAQRLHV
jgi:hypothetical protein